jgi:hypothetical protein
MHLHFISWRILTIITQIEHAFTVIVYTVFLMVAQYNESLQASCPGSDAW